jgi:NAD+ diphosphatase
MDHRPFTGMALDRAAELREDPERVSSLLADPEARAVAAGRDGVLVTGDAVSRIALNAHAANEPLLLGLEDGTPLFAVDLEHLAASERDSLTHDATIVTMRQAGTTLPQSEAGLAAYAAALLNWHRASRFCANCGAATELAKAGYVRVCPVCATTHFPRTDPVVIMSVGHHGRLLLGRRVGAPHGRYSVLAGFVSPGESAEEAVIREVFEESGVGAREPAFVASQPWPFPASLMLGFDADSDGATPEPRDGELDEVDWFDADEVRSALAGSNHRLALPPPVSIAWFLIRRWVDRQA